MAELSEMSSLASKDSLVGDRARPGSWDANPVAWLRGLSGMDMVESARSRPCQASPRMSAVFDRDRAPRGESSGPVCCGVRLPVCCGVSISVREYPRPREEGVGSSVGVAFISS